MIVVLPPVALTYGVMVLPPAPKPNTLYPKFDTTSSYYASLGRLVAKNILIPSSLASPVNVSEPSFASLEMLKNTSSSAAGDPAIVTEPL